MMQEDISNEANKFEVQRQEKLSRIKLAPYICKARALISVPRISGENMFRHQMVTLTILLDYLIIDSVLLKAAVIHDIEEDARDMPWLSRDEIVAIDVNGEGEQVFDLVTEVTRRIDGFGRKEPKSQYLRRIMENGSNRAKILTRQG